MSDYEVIKNPDNDLWSSFLSNFTEGNFRHSYECGEIDKKTFSSLKVVRLAIVKKREFLSMPGARHSHLKITIYYFILHKKEVMII